MWLGLRRRWSAVATWLVTWGVTELVLANAKSYLHRGRPPHPLVATSGYAFPSGHAVAGAATGVALASAAIVGELREDFLARRARGCTT